MAGEKKKGKKEKQGGGGMRENEVKKGNFFGLRQGEANSNPVYV